MRRVSTIQVSRVAALLLALAPAASATRAADRSVTILEGVDEPVAPAETVPQAVQEAAPAILNTPNTAGMTLAILPGTEVPLGTRINFSVSTRQPGYLVIVDINADGKITQIFPNMMSLAQASGDVASANLVKPGAAIAIPNAKNPLARFSFTADEPRGSGAIVAMLSDRPVQLIDLPAVAPSAGGLQEVVTALDTAVARLKIASAGNASDFAESAWSFAAVPYTIR